MSRRRIYKRNEVLQQQGGGFLERESKKQKSEQCIA